MGVQGTGNGKSLNKQWKSYVVLNHRQISNIRRIKSQNLNAARLVL